MTSEIRANTLKNRVGLGTISFTDTGPVVSGIITTTGDVYLGNDIYLTDGSGGYEQVEVSVNDIRVKHKHIHSEFGVWTRSTSVTDRKNGIESGGNDLRLYSNSTEKVRINDTGWVGANQTTRDHPGQIAAFKNTSNVNSWLSVNVNNNTGIGGVVFGDSDAWAPAYVQYNHTTNIMQFISNGSERLRIKSDGSTQTITRSAGLRRMILSGSPTNSSFNIEAHDGATGTASGTIQGELGLYYNDGSTLSDTATIKFERGNGAPDGAMTFFTNNNERLRIKSDGKVGINRNNPDALLHIHNSGTSVLPLKVYRNDVGDVPIVHFQGYNNAIGVVDKFVVTARGRVGVNTDNPQRELHVKPSDNNPATAVPGYIRIEGNGSDQAAILELYHTRSNGSDKWPSSVASVDGGLTLNVATGNNGNPQERLRITSGGQFIFNHDSVGTTYDFNGPSGDNNWGGYLRLNSYNGSTVQAEIRTSTSGMMFGYGGSERLRITSAGDTELRNTVSGITNSYSQYLKFRTTQTNGQSAVTGQIAGQGKSSWGGDLVFYTKPANGTPNDTLSERLRIDSSGRVGVNQSSFATSDTMFSVSETSGHCEIGIISKNDSGVVINMGDTDSYNQGRIKYDNSDNSLTFRTVGTDRLRINSDGSIELSNTDDNGIHNISNHWHGNLDFVNRENRVLTSNGAGWRSGVDGADPILVLSCNNDSGRGPERGQNYGLCLHTDSQANNTYAPMIGFTNRSNSGNYNTTFAAILAKKIGQATDANWSTGQLEFYTNKPVGHGDNGYMNATPDLTIDQYGHILAPRNCRFYAISNSGATDTPNSGTGKISNYLETEYIDENSDYDTSNGRFTAPVDGAYEFHFAALLRCLSNSGSGELTFYKNGSNLSQRSFGYANIGSGGSTGDHQHHHIHGIFNLVAGDYIEVYIYAMSSGMDYYTHQGLSYFSGKLLG